MRTRFLRACVEIIHHETGGMALPRLREGLAGPLQSSLRDVLASTERDASVELGPALELLLGLDGVLCGGSGVVTTRIAAALASRVLSQSAGLVVAGDVVTTLQHLRAPFEHPFLDVSLQFLARRSPGGFTLELGVPHEPRAARWLASAGLGYAKAAARFSGDGVARQRLYAEVKGNIARVLGRHTDSGVVTLLPEVGAGSLRDAGQPARRRAAPTNAAERVEQILSRAPGRASPPSEPPSRAPERRASLSSLSSRASLSPAASAESGTRLAAAPRGLAPRVLATSAPAQPESAPPARRLGLERPSLPTRAAPASAAARKSARS